MDPNSLYNNAGVDHIWMVLVIVWHTLGIQVWAFCAVGSCLSLWVLVRIRYVAREKLWGPHKMLQTRAPSLKKDSGYVLGWDTLTSNPGVEEA